MLELVNHPNVKFKYVGYCLYYTFRHEQDAFAHQFYGFLMQNKPNLPFDDLVRYTELYQCTQCYKTVIKNYWNDKDVKKYLNSFGFTFEKWKKKVHYGMMRLERKLRNAYKTYMLNVNEFRIKHGNLILEEYEKSKVMYGEDMTFSVETIFDFNSKPTVVPLKLKCLF